MKDGYREFGKWMQQVEKLWAEKRGEKATKRLLTNGSTIKANSLPNTFLTDISYSTTTPARTLPQLILTGNANAPFVVDVKLYGATFSTLEEADYVAAILNSDVVNVAIKPFQSTGLLGERDIHKKLLELPIPTFDHEKKSHVIISELGAEARGEAAAIAASETFPAASTIARQRAFMRTALKDKMREINKLVINLLKGSATGE